MSIYEWYLPSHGGWKHIPRIPGDASLRDQRLDGFISADAAFEGASRPIDVYKGAMKCYLCPEPKVLPMS